ncbi:MAG: hypothetical protein JRN52_05495 [Nitrososphaerota archaeon]|nr:hypothetical protein [Nitrososphaerota archaeon]
MIVFDDTATAAVSLWDSRGKELLEGSDVSPGDLVKISSAYVRAAIDGTPTLNAGDKTKIERLSATAELKIPTLDSRVLSCDSIPEDGRMMIVKGKISDAPRRNGFTRKDGTSSEFCAFSLAGSSAETRVVIWNNQDPVFSSLKKDETITLLNVRSKSSTFQNQGAIELHGDEGSCILERWNETKLWMKQKIKPLSGNSERQESKSVLPLIARVISAKRTEAERAYLLLVDSQKRLIQLVASGEALRGANDLGVDDVVVCKPESFDPVSMKASCSKSGAISKVSSKRQDIPNHASYTRTIENLEEAAVASLYVMCLSDSVSREIQTKDGLVRRSEILAADPTGEIKVYAWRNLSKLLEGVSAGDTLNLNAVEVQSHEGKKFLVLKNYSTVEATKP